MKFTESKIRIVKPGEKGTLINEYGEPITPPKNWAFLPAGDAGITRKVTAKGEYWRVQFKKVKIAFFMSKYFGQSARSATLLKRQNQL